MAAPKPTAAERAREAQERALRRRRQSARVGTVGVILLFLGALGVVLSPSNALYLIVLMVLGIVLLFAAFLLVGSPLRELSKIT